MRKGIIGGMAAAAALAVPATAAADTDDKTRAVRGGEAKTNTITAEREARRLIGGDNVLRLYRTQDGALVPARDRALASASSADGPQAVARASACVPCVIIVATAARAVAARAVGAAAAAGTARTIATNAGAVFVMNAARQFPKVSWPARKLQQKFTTHARDWGIIRPWSETIKVNGRTAAEEFMHVIQQHMSSPTTIKILGSIRGKDGLNHHAVHFYDVATKRVATFTPEGEFITAYFVRNPKMQERLLKVGHLGQMGKWNAFGDPMWKLLGG